MDNLDELYSHLLEAQDAIYTNKLSQAKMSLMSASKLLKPVKDDCVDAKQVWHILESIKTYLSKRVSLYCDQREWLSEEVEVLIEECESWLNCQRRAA